MKQIFLGWLIACVCPGLVYAETASAQVQELAQKQVQVLSVQNPASYAGIQIGDVLQRTMRLSVAAGDQLNDSKLPLKGLQRNGVELRQLHIASQKQGGQQVYTLVFDYQVFASSGKPVQLQLPAEQLTFNSGATVSLPSWRFWLVAQLPDQLQKAKQSVIAQYPPALLDTQTPQRGLALSLLLAVVGGLVLLYRHADWNLLPMGKGHFSRAYRKLKKLTANADGQKQAALLVQDALNQRFGRQMLAKHVTEFTSQQPAFKPLEQELHAFFAQANAVLYSGQSYDAAAYLQQCKAFTRQLRDCERGV
jgi:mxaA protein